MSDTQSEEEKNSHHVPILSSLFFVALIIFGLFLYTEGNLNGLKEDRVFAELPQEGVPYREEALQEEMFPPQVLFASFLNLANLPLP